MIPEIRQRLVEPGAPLLCTETEGRLALVERQVRAFEVKYGMTLAELRRSGLPDDASMEMHEDFVEWSGWQYTHEEASRTISRPAVETAATSAKSACADSKSIQPA